MRAASKIDEPDYGHVFASMLIEDGATVAHADFCVPRVEPELTFILKSPLQGPGLTLEDVLEATETVVPSRMNIREPSVFHALILTGT